VSTDRHAAVQLVIFGGRGQLARHKLIPALARLALIQKCDAKNS
jgi:glucose-6-phosphate 1-dehydrogenase